MHKGLQREVVVVAGVGSGTGAAIVKRFAREGCDVAMLARNEEYLHRLADECTIFPGRVMSLPCDITQFDQVAKAFEHIHNSIGEASILVNHASGGGWNGLEETEIDAFENAWRNSAFGAFLCSKIACRDMLKNERGAIIFTGATSSLRGRAGAVAFSSAKFAVRGLAWAMASELGAKGIHVAHVVIDGVIQTPHSTDSLTLLPDHIADAYWNLAHQPRSAWTFELDLRPAGEQFYE